VVDPTETDLLARLVALTEEQLRWQRAAALTHVRRAVESALSSPQRRQAYDLCDGDHTFRQIADAVGASVGSISSWTRQWRDVGIVFENASGRMEHLISSVSLGLPTEQPQPDDKPKRGRQ
jgi:hypothetical protein